MRLVAYSSFTHITILLGTFKKGSLLYDIILPLKFEKLIYSKFIQPENIQVIDHVKEVLKLDKSKDDNDMQSAKRSCITEIWEVSKLDKSNVVNDEQFLNILNIIVTLEVSKLSKFNDVIDMQLSNIECISLLMN